MGQNCTVHTLTTTGCPGEKPSYCNGVTTRKYKATAGRAYALVRFTGEEEFGRNMCLQTCINAYKREEACGLFFKRLPWMHMPEEAST